MNSFEFDIIVVGGGHAGCEAAMAASSLGSRTLLISPDLTGFAKMSCNPAVGGIAKGQIVREIDALGGYTGIVTDAATLQFRMLNRSKGPAMWSPRAQCDKQYFSAYWRKILESSCNLRLYADFATSFLFENEKIAGVRTNTGAIFHSRAVILTAGTFLEGKLFIGRTEFEGGRIGEISSHGLTGQLVERGIPSSRMKTGTPPRIDISTVDTSSLILQTGDPEPERFSFLPNPSPVQSGTPQLPCYILHTNEEVHDILRSGFADSPLFTGMIHGKGPRYCPSIEDKIRTFADKDSHQLFLEPEAREGREYYLQGFSSSLPLDIQIAAMRKVPGLEHVEIFRPAYAVEYDYFDPVMLKPSLESRVIDGLFLAGQVNGTTGYEEAAAQGIIAGINAHRKLAEKDPLVLGRDQAYIGVLIDDLITKGVDEPYRMFTSRAEYRILLRQDNADARLTELSYNIGLVDKFRYELTMKKYEKVSRLQEFCDDTLLKAGVANELLTVSGSTPITDSKTVSDLAARPEVSLKNLLEIVPRGTKERHGVSEEKEVVESVEISIKYKGYIEREKALADKIKRLENLKIPEGFNFDALSGLSIECRQKLNRYRPSSIAQASRISGVSPSDISVLLVYFGR
ncbi:MAG: tRNA uridine-5-carboxymethylaminomethyl(34) synthesis enzyme MnmG [Bacteroidales bacterium]|nr:tRNA uridine-5-carboxymethylaminomethyl(34) synthesis enzyme MnmG [Bacteroidales bacterium]